MMIVMIIHDGGGPFLVHQQSASDLMKISGSWMILLSMMITNIMKHEKRNELIASHVLFI